MSGWLDGYAPDRSDEEPLAAQRLPAPPRAAAAPATPRVLLCTHCGSDRLHLRSSDPDSERIKFRCEACARISAILLPYGYRRVYVAIDP